MMINYTPAQRLAIYEVDCNMAVVAGAGAGKTKVLVERYLYLLLSGRAGCEQIYAITFTRKAAKEMRERIRDGIAAMIERQNTATERAAWFRVAQQLEQAPITTIHGLCARLLRENPVEAVLDPNFLVLDEVTANLLLDSAVQAVLDEALLAQRPWLAILFNYFTRRELARSLAGLYQKLASMDWLDEHLGERLAKPYKEAGARLLALRRRCCEDFLALIALREEINPKLATWRQLTALAERQDSILEAIAAYGGDGHQAAAAMIEGDLLKNKIAARGKIGGTVKDFYAGLEELKAAYCDLQALPVIFALSEALLAVHSAYLAEKGRRHVLDYTDLEIRAYRLLKDYPTVCKRYGQRCRFLLVDEFQDTNEVQRRIIYLLAGGSQDILRGNKLFIVGDPKQSIYRFRGADVTVFERVARDIEASGGKRVILDQNFRSVPGILSVLNELFAVLMGTALDTTVPYVPLNVYRADVAPDKPSVEILTADKSNAGDLRQAEAQAIAAHIQYMVTAGHTFVADKSGSRPVNYGDIAVLFASTTHQKVYEAALQAAGVPYYIVGSRNFYQRQEIIDIINLLKVIDNHHDTVALAGVLRSPLFLLADDTLVVLQLTAGSLWEGLANPQKALGLNPEQQAAAARAWQVINRLRRLQGLVPVDQLIRLAISETGYDRFLLTQFMGVQQYANVQKLIALARQYQLTEMASLNDFLRYINKLMDEGAQEGEAQLDSEQGNAVKLMTIHNAKGLEFPVVFLPDIGRDFQWETGALLFDPEQGLGLKLQGFDGTTLVTSRHRLVAERERQLSVLEMKRLLYVAMTRAKDRLVLSAANGWLLHDKKVQYLAERDFCDLNSWQKWLQKIYGPWQEDQHELRLVQAPIAITAAKPWDTGVPSRNWETWIAAGEPPDLPRQLARQLSPVESAATGIRLSPTAVNHFKQCPRSFFYRYVVGLPEIGYRSDSGKTGQPAPAHLVGSVVHRSCELLATGVDLIQALRQAVADMVPHHWREEVGAAALLLLERLINSDFFREAALYPSCQEVSFTYYLRPADNSGQVFEFNGSIDRLLFYPDGSLGIIDYKTDQIESEQVEQRAKSYQWQLALYVLAAKSLFKSPVRDARLYFLRPAAAVHLPVAEEWLAAAKAELEQICQFVSRHRQEADYKPDTAFCRQCNYQLFCPAFVLPAQGCN